MPETGARRERISDTTSATGDRSLYCRKNHPRRMTQVSCHRRISMTLHEKSFVTVRCAGKICISEVRKFQSLKTILQKFRWKAVAPHGSIRMRVTLTATPQIGS